MREWYTYEIWTRKNGSLQLEARRDHLFSREPTENVRSLLQMWIIENHDNLQGGERLTVHGAGARTLPVNRIAVVQVLLYRGRLHQAAEERTGRQDPIASAFLSHRRPRSARPHSVHRPRVKGSLRRWFPRAGLDDAA